MSKQKNLLDELGDKFFSNTYQLQRIVILVGIVLLLAVVSFGGYYYYDRYYRPQPKAAEVTIAQAEQAVKDNPANIQARLNLAQSYMNNRRWSEAIDQASQVSVAEPDNQLAWLVIGVCYANNGQPVNAVAPLTKFVDARKDEDMPGLDHELQAAAYYLGDSYLQLGQPKDAIAPLEKAVNWSTTDADAMYKLGMAYAGTNDHEKAINMFLGATAFVPDFIEAYAAMAESYKALNKPDLVDYAEGMMAYAKKDYQGARLLLEKSAQARADFPPIFTGLGRVYESLNDLPKAKSAYETALKLDPNNFTANNGIQRVTALINK